MKLKIGFLALLFIFLSCKSQSNLKAEKVLQIVLLSGQSNMVGHGNYDELSTNLKERIQKVSSRVFVSNSGENPKTLSLIKGNKSDKYKFSKHFGPELLIGLTLAEKYPKQEFLLIKKAVGGTSLYGAWNVNWTLEKALTSERGKTRQNLKLFGAHINNIKKHLKRLDAEGKKHKIIGVTWLQGEGDTNKEITAINYKVNLQNLVSAYRKELSIKELPFIIGQINALPRKYKKGPKQVRAGMLAVAGADQNIGIIKTIADKPWSDFPKHSDNLHYNTEGQKRLGIAFAEELMKLSK